jgi:hypothetical protein
MLFLLLKNTMTVFKENICYIALWAVVCSTEFALKLYSVAKSFVALLWLKVVSIERRVFLQLLWQI